MTVICRAVDGERVECPGCKKSLTIRVLAYKHHRFCRTLADRVAQRTARARERYNRDLRRARGDDSDDAMSTEDVSENSPRATSENSSGGQKSVIFPGTTAEATPPEQIDEKTQDATLGATSELQLHEKTNGTTPEATAVTFFDKKTAEATAGRKKTAWGAPQGTPEVKKTPQATPVAQYRLTAQRQGIDAAIASMFHK